MGSCSKSNFESFPLRPGIFSAPSPISIRLEPVSKRVTFLSLPSSARAFIPRCHSRTNDISSKKDIEVLRTSGLDMSEITIDQFVELIKVLNSIQ